jgi:hypothetical protein
MNSQYPITQYNATPRDTAGLDDHETILGHLVLEQRLSFNDALYYLDSMARSEVKDWHAAKNNTQAGLWASVGAGGIAFVSAGFGPVGMAAGGVIAAIGCGFSWFIKDRAEHIIPFRECEANLIAHHPWTRDEMKRLTDSGVPVSMVISRYDLMLKSFFAAGGVTSDPNAVRQLLQPVAPEPLPQAAQSIVSQPVSALVQKRMEREQRNILGSIPIDDSPIALPVEPSQLAIIQNWGQQEPIAAPTVGTPQFVAEMSHAVKSSLIVGIPGSGKDLTIAHLLSEVKRRRPDLTLIGIDPKNDAKESGYYRNFESGNLDRFKAKLLSPWEIQERLDRSLSLALNRENVLFFINEFATLVGFCDDKWMKQFNAKLQAIVQMGDSENQYLWIASQTGNLKELKMDSSLRATLGANTLAIVRPGSDAAIAGLTRTDLIMNHDEPRMRAMMERSPVSRAYYYSRLGKWEAMPTLPNLSGYDRDKRAWVDGFVPVEPVSDATEFNVAAVDRALGNVLPFVSKDVQAATGDDDIKSELVRYLSGVTEPKKVSQIRTSIKPPHRGIGSDELRLVLADLVAENQIQVVGSRFTVSS